MALAQEINPPVSPVGSPIKSTTGFAASRSGRPPSARITTDTEKLSHLFPPNKTIQKSKSMTEAEIRQDVMNDEEIAAVNERLKTEDPPMSLEEVRKRREDIKEERKRSIDFIRERTNSRASVLGRPNLEALMESKRTG